MIIFSDILDEYGNHSLMESTDDIELRSARLGKRVRVVVLNMIGPLPRFLSIETGRRVENIL